MKKYFFAKRSKIAFIISIILIGVLYLLISKYNDQGYTSKTIITPENTNTVVYIYISFMLLVNSIYIIFKPRILIWFTLIMIMMFIVAVIFRVFFIEYIMELIGIFEMGIVLGVLAQIIPSYESKFFYTPFITYDKEKLKKIIEEEKLSSK